MDVNTNRYMQNRSMANPVQSYANSPIFQSTINYGTQSIFPNAGLSQSMKILNDNIPTQSTINNNINVLSDYRNGHLIMSQMPPQVKYYNRSLNPRQQYQKILSPPKKIYGHNLKTSYIASPIKTINILPTKYIHNNPMVSNQIFNIDQFATVSKIVPPQDDYHNVKNFANTQIIQQPTKEYYSPITNVIPAIDIKRVSFADVTPITPVITPTPIANFTQEPFTTQTPITNITPATPVMIETPITNITPATPAMIDTPFTKVESITYQTEEYKTTNYQNQNEPQSINYELEKKDPITGDGNFSSNYLIEELVEIPPEHTTTTINSEIIYEDEKRNNNINDYYLNSPVKEESIEEIPHSYIHHSPIVENRINLLSPIQSPLSNYETQSYNEESILYKLENELFNLRVENESYKKQLQELERYKFEASETKVLREQVEQLSPLKEQLEELVSMKAQLAELNDLKLKIKELENLRFQVEQITSGTKKNKKFLGKHENKDKIARKKIEVKKNIKSQKEQNVKEEENNKNIVLKDKTEQSFVNGDIIHNIEEFELLIRKINKSSKKMTLNLIYKASVDSDRAVDFHKKCNNAKKTLVLIETDKGRRFGGYTSVNWKGKCIEKMDKDAFVFSLDKMKIYDNIPEEKAIGCYPRFGPVFLGCQIRIYDRAFQKGGTTYKKGLNYRTTEDFELNGGDRIFKVKDIEVYEVIHQ